MKVRCVWHWYGIYCITSFALMQCTNCNFEYCYMCKRPWADHGGGFFQCKFYEEEIKTSNRSEAVVDWEGELAALLTCVYNT